jgi:hypothetical protein
VKAIDDDGLQSNWTTASTGFRIDTLAPALSTKSTFTSDWYTTNQTSTFAYTDAGSGIASGNNPTCTISTDSATATCTNSAINVCDNAGNCNTDNQTSNTIKLDKTAPTGGSISYPNTNQRDASIAITVDAGTDATAGLSSTNSDYLLEVATATHDGSTCGTFSSFANANVSETASATQYIYANTTVNNCYKFRYTVKDLVGNTNTYTSTDVTVISTNGLSLPETFNDHNNGASSTDTTPTLGFNLPADPDGDTIKYQIQIDNNANFSSPEIDVTELD